MSLPEFIRALPPVDLPFQDDQVTTNAVQSAAGLAVFFTFHKDFILPPHAHKGQWGMVISGEIELTVADQTRIYRAGESYTIPAGAVHSAQVAAGTVVLDLFEEPYRYALRR